VVNPRKPSHEPPWASREKHAPITLILFINEENGVKGGISTYDKVT